MAAHNAKKNFDIVGKLKMFKKFKKCQENQI